MQTTQKNYWEEIFISYMNCFVHVFKYLFINFLVISEMIDRLKYDNVPLGFNEKDVISKIKNEAISFLRLDV
ncbi:hypothetical protein BKP37_18990 [Anaerobacillus alkalilacustris]|uniref:Uncharacterized protein n=1 Tax=Anaerobacillus alkalilacustris TaxID=393763 RepID=A0A1S2LFY7_9BACI|nr:hypothetical protein BKP37_18990 [Anaerobacillus alkalilacustris]